MSTKIVFAGILLFVTSAYCIGQGRFVYRVVVSSPDRTLESRLTGFRLKGTRGIITALHGVSKSAVGYHIFVEQDASVHERPFTEEFHVTQIDVEKDLA